MNELIIVDLDYLADSSLWFERFLNERLPCFLDSGGSGYSESHSRYDIISANPWAVVAVDNQGQTNVTYHKTNTVTRHDQQCCFELLSQLLEQMTPVSGSHLPFTGGAMGFWGYELASVLESRRIASREMQTPLMSVGLYHWALITDHELKKTHIVFHPDCSKPDREKVLALIDQQPDNQSATFKLTSNFKPSITKAEYEQAFNRIQDYILAGDCYEVNLTQEFTASYQGQSWAAYKKLRKVSPAPYSAYLSHPDFDILSHSPERFIKVLDRHVETHPIKGTRPRGTSDQEDRQHAEELLACEKDRAENLMIVDLLRNDLGKICKTGSIKVPRLFGLESYANVHHLVSTVTGELDEEHQALDALFHAFPGGSITGAPKIRSMEIIRELEASARNIYCGSIGYISTDGQMDTSITIRSLIAQNNRLHCWGGGAIVADSDCEQEYQESVTKVKNLMHGLENM
ncbi:aminodeoxychorismate synthase [Endozoicomonas montiporae]|uniref:aminodeoxychorismate synthase n=2 Tax=Endozoicomonas montiporae TaxID=1027273 RepID=A0A081N6R8_9GAMM|nr:aminodeoxychorismate synthase component I [Endozoicomonas montiporae]KEQ14141.1 aminodeoxychorismate synthase [Endozoicomonas montiporae]